jgi:hypothetical protein
MDRIIQLPYLIRIGIGTSSTKTVIINNLGYILEKKRNIFLPNARMGKAESYLIFYGWR